MACTGQYGINTVILTDKPKCIDSKSTEHQKARKKLLNRLCTYLNRMLKRKSEKMSQESSSLEFLGLACNDYTDYDRTYVTDGTSQYIVTNNVDQLRRFRRPFCGRRFFSYKPSIFTWYENSTDGMGKQCSIKPLRRPKYIKNQCKSNILKSEFLDDSLNSTVFYPGCISELTWFQGTIFDKKIISSSHGQFDENQYPWNTALREQDAKLKCIHTMMYRLNTYLNNWLFIEEIELLSKNLHQLELKINKKSEMKKFDFLIRRFRIKKRLNRISQQVLDFELSSSTLERAKQRASVLWLVSKAYNNKVPPDLKEPYYKDHEEKYQLKPQIIQKLASAELYCLALANIYADPNYHNLDHHGIQQALMRKMIFVNGPPDAPLTETALLQTAPLRMSAHMAVIGGIMALYIKEILIPEKVVDVCRRFSSVLVPDEVPKGPEDAAILWLNKCCIKMRWKIEGELGSYHTSQKASYEQQKIVPYIPIIEDLADLSDGCSLNSLLSFYCPNYLHWKEICFHDPMKLSDSVYNLQLIEQFCTQILPCDIYFLTLEDMLYMHSSLRQNVLAFIADLMFLFEIRPAKCVIRPGIKEEQKLSIEGPVAPRRRNQPSPKYPSTTLVAHQSWSHIPGLHDFAHSGSLPDLNRPSPWTDGDWSALERSPKRKSRHQRVSATVLPSALHRTQSADFQVKQRLDSTGFQYNAVEKANGGRRCPSDEEDDLEVYFEKKPLTHKKGEIGEEQKGYERVSCTSGSEPEQRKSMESDKNYPQKHFSQSNGDFYYKQHAPHKTSINKPQGNSENIGLRDYYNQLASEAELEELCKTDGNIDHDTSRLPDQKDHYGDMTRVHKDSIQTARFAQLSKLKENQRNPVNILYMQQEDDSREMVGSKNQEKVNMNKLKDNPLEEEEVATAVAPANVVTTTWLKQQQQQQQHIYGNFSLHGDSGGTTPINGSENALASQLLNIRLALEERRRKIEQDKKHMEALWKRHRQKLGKAAFLQAVSKGVSGTPDNGTGKEEAVVETTSSTENTKVEVSRSISRQLSAQELEEDLESVKEKWLNKNRTQLETTVVADEENLNPEIFQKSIDHINNSLTELQADITRLSQQNIIQQSDKNQIAPAPGIEPFSLCGQEPFQQSQQKVQPAPLQQQFQQPQEILSSHPTQQDFQDPQQRLPPNKMQMQYQHPFKHKPSEQMSDVKRGQWTDIVRPDMIGQLFTNQQQQLNISSHHDHWGQPVVPRIPHQRQSQPPPVMMSGHSFMDEQTQGFSLQPEHINYEYPGYQNGSAEITGSDEQNYQPYSSITGPVQYQGLAYPLIPASLPNLSQQQQPFQLHEQPHPLMPHFFPNQMTAQVQQTLSQTTLPLSHVQKDTKQIVGVSKPAVQLYEHKTQILEVDEFGRSVKDSRPQIGKTFRVHKPKVVSSLTPKTEAVPVKTKQLPSQPIKNVEVSDKGFYISFNNAQPKKPKPKVQPHSLKSQESNSKMQFSKLQDLKPFSSREEGWVIDSSHHKTETLEAEREKPAESNNTLAKTQHQNSEKDVSGVGFVIGADLVHPNPDAESEMQKKKEMIMMMSLKRRAEQEKKRIAKENSNAKKKEKEIIKKEIQEKKKEEEKTRREKILEQYRQRKELEEAEKNGLPLPSGSGFSTYHDASSRSGTLSKSKSRSTSASRPRPKSVNVSNLSQESSSFESFDATRVGRGSHNNLLKDVDQEDIDSFYGYGAPPKPQVTSPSCGSYHNFRHPPSPCQAPPSLPSGRSKGSGPSSDGASDTGSTSSAVTSEFLGPKLFVKPTSKSNRGIITNAVNTVLAGAVNAETKKKVLEAISNSNSKHFLILFRDSGCQFRAIYSYNPEQEEIFKLYGTGPKVLGDPMMNGFYKYNSGGKCFTKVHTKHLTVTIDAVTLHNSIWQGKKGMPPKKDLL
ncbi:patronin-like isoform X2 [Tachypleus tridentatus]|uniref:patronin-like isoform X2 n=1 Tax=Tachypleus tridentatus TaxID=6853 RepID=UPI003FD092BB